MGEGSIRVLLVDDHALVRYGLSTFFSTYPEIEVVGEAENGKEAIAACVQQCPDVVLMDVHMPDMDGIEAARHIRQLCVAVRIVMLTGDQSRDLQEAALIAGANNYLIKKSPSEIVNCILESTM
jgi:two-component system, NarL family, response regulator LiaR